MNSVYILYSEKLKKFYTGFTSNLENRLEYHKSALPHKFTAKANDWEIFLTIECESKKQALAIETHIKKMKSKVYIKNLVKYQEMIDKLKHKYI